MNFSVRNYKNKSPWGFKVIWFLLQVRVSPLWQKIHRFTTQLGEGNVIKRSNRRADPNHEAYLRLVQTTAWIPSTPSLLKTAEPFVGGLVWTGLGRLFHFLLCRGEGRGVNQKQWKSLVACGVRIWPHACPVIMFRPTFGCDMTIFFSFPSTGS